MKSSAVCFHHHGVFKFLLVAVLLAVIDNIKCDVTKGEKSELKDKVIEMFHHAYGSYMRYAYPADELMPLSCKGRYRGSEPDRGDIDESLGNFSLTLIDTLDTLAVLGNVSEFERAVTLVISDVKFDADVVVSVFETNIRVLGGLLGGHVVSKELQEKGLGMRWYKTELLDMAVDIADRLLVAFNTTTGIPYPRVNLLYGIHHPMSRIVDEKDTCTACGGTMIMEFAALSRLTGDSIYEQKAHKAMESIWHYRSRSSDLVGTVIDIHNGDWIRRDSGIGAGIDSYYEYCLKAYILLGDKSYLEKFKLHYAAINKYIKQGAMMLDVLMHQPDRPIRSFVDSLQAFWPGLQVLMGDLKPAIETHEMLYEVAKKHKFLPEVLKGDLKPAIETHEMLYEVAKKHKFLPEAFTTNYDLYWSQHPLRPEFAESTYFLYEATKDPYYLEVGKHIVETLEQHARVECGFAAIQDLRTFTHEDKMDSFVLAETFKYLYLLFSEESERILNIHNFVFTTEAHLLPLTLASVKFDSDRKLPKKDETEAPMPSAEPNTPTSNHQSTCPNDAKDRFSMREFARVVRNGYRKPSPATPICNTVSSTSKTGQELFKSDPNREPKLHAEQFQVGNTVHMQLLKEMGITVMQTNDGKVQLMHQAGTALTAEDAADGIKFMQDMIQLSKTRTGDPAAALKRRFVQLMSPPFNGEVKYGAGAAQFGLDISDHVGIVGEIVEANPFGACKDILNSEDVEDRIVIAERGGCMFIDKVRRLEALGAKGVIIVDNHEGTSGHAQPMFAMSGDSHPEDVKIPSVFLFRKEGDVLRQYAKDSINENNIRLRVRLAGNPNNENESENKSDTTSSETSEKTNETDNKVEKEANVSSQSAFRSEVTVEHKGAAIEIKGESLSDNSESLSDNSNVEYPMKKETVLDKMEASMEQSPHVVSIRKDGNAVISTKTETHIGRDENGNLVTFETTYTSFEEQDKGNPITRIRVLTKTIPFQTSALEIDQASLDNKAGKGVTEKKGENLKENISGEDSSELDEAQEGGVPKPVPAGGEGKTLPSIEEFIESATKIKDAELADKGDVGVKEGEMVKEEAAIAVNDGEGDLEKVGLRKQDGKEPGSAASKEKESVDATEEDGATPKEEGSSIGNVEQAPQEGRLKEGEIEQDKQTISDEKQPQNVICNAAGCFSSLEELDMFNKLALQVRNNLQNMDAIEAANIEKQAATDENAKSDDNTEGSKHYPSDR